MDVKTQKVLKTLNPNKIIIPIIIGLGVLLFFFFSNDEVKLSDIIENTKKANLIWVFLAVIVLFIRDLGYMYRIRHLTDKKLNWSNSFFVIILWEFASAITPSVVGGTAVAIFILNREGIPFGKSMAYVMLTALLDNMFFVIASITVLLIYPFDIFPDLSAAMEESFHFPLKTSFIISVSLIALYSFLMAFGLLAKPRFFKWLMIKITSLSFLRRWRYSAAQTGNDMIVASSILREKTLSYWLRASISTIFIWSARYFMLNCLIAAFTGINLMDHFLIFARQIIMWIVMLISPTPGSTGTAEGAFMLFFGEFFSVIGLTVAVALFWRLFTYYAYLILGAVFLPRWLRKVLVKTQE